MRAQIRRCPAYLLNTQDYVPLPLADFGAIASLSSERNAVNKSSALTMNRFPSRCASTQSLALRVGDQLWRSFAEADLVAHFLNSSGEGFDLFL